MTSLSSVSRRPYSHRAGSTYVAVLGVAMIVSICTFTGMQIARLQLRTTKANNDLQRARLLAFAAVEHAVATMRTNASWRTTYASGADGFQFEDGDESFLWRLDDNDGNLGDDATDPVAIQGIGRCGRAVWVHRATARPDRGRPLECLNTAIHCSKQLRVLSGKVLTVSGKPASTDSNLVVEGTIAGDAHGVTRSGAGTITGTTVVPAERKGVPWPNVFDDYVARATHLAFAGNLSKILLAPGANTYGGGINPDGIYYLNTAGTDLTIQNTRLLGTLVVNAGAGTVTIAPPCFMQPSRDDLPVLIVKGNLDLGLLRNQYLREQATNSNFNPPGAPYRNETDSDKTDTYPSQICGLIHVIGNVSIGADCPLPGSLAVQGTATILSNCEIVHDPNLILNPPLGYSDDPHGTAMILQSRSWTRQPPP